MPFADDEVRISLACGPDAAGRWHGRLSVSVAADALRRHGLHPDQPMSNITGPVLSAWWHIAAERSWHRTADELTD
jgi:hypothetical protein